VEVPQPSISDTTIDDPFGEYDVSDTEMLNSSIGHEEEAQEDGPGGGWADYADMEKDYDPKKLEDYKYEALQKMTDEKMLTYTVS